MRPAGGRHWAGASSPGRLHDVGTSLNISTPAAGAGADCVADQDGALRFVVTLLNVGGLNSGNIVNTLSTAVDCKTDVLVMCETKLDHGGVQMSAPAEWGFAQFVDRGRPRGHGPSSGGVGVGTLNRTLKLELVTHTPLGGVAVKVSHRHGNHTPLYLIALYVPPITSTRSADRDPLLNWGVSTYHALKASGNNHIVIGGDLNTRPTCIRGHYSDDKAATKSPAERSFARLLRKHKLSPLHGRSKRCPAGTTSRQVTLREGAGTAEVDYAITSTDASFATPLPPLPWGPTSHGTTHRAVSAVVLLPPRTTAASAPPMRRPATVRPPPYPDAATYHRVARSLRGLTHAAAPDLAHVQRALASMTRRLMPSKPPRRGLTVVRRYKGFPLPADLVARIAATRRARRQLKATAPGTPAHAARRSELNRQELLNKLASRRMLRRRAAEVSNSMERARGFDAHQMHRQLNALFPDDHTLVGTDARELSTEAARAHWAESLLDTRPGVLPGATTASALQHVPVAAEPPAASGLAVPPSAAAPAPAAAHDQVLLTRNCIRNAIWGPSARRPPARCSANPLAACPICESVHRRWLAACADPAAAMPTDGPHVRTSKGVGPDSIPAELLRFMRLPDDPEGTERIRNHVSDLIANALNLAIHTNSFPASFTITNLTPLLKSSKVPHQDRASANNYRPVVTAVYLDKVLDAVLTRRLTHWTIRNKLIGNEQIGFMPGRSAEEHVAVLREAIHSRSQAGADTYVLFLDLKKAYDRVHIRTLARILEHAGVPSSVTNLLVTLSSARQTRIKLSGSLSEPFPATAGVPQGGIRSPILFDLFIESLSRHLKSTAAYTGVDVVGVNVRHLLYADDACALAVSTEQIQTVAFVAAHWCRMWGMEANIGGGKTELMHFAPPGVTAAHQLRSPPRVWWPWNGSYTAIPWTTHYRYLGFPISTDLANDAATFSGAQRAALTKNMYRYYSHNPLRPFMSLRCQKLVFINTIVSSTTYLRGVILRDLVACSKIDAVALKMARKLLGTNGPLPLSATNLLVILHSGVHLAYAQQAQMRVRVLETARLTPGSLLNLILDGQSRGNHRHKNLANVARRQAASEQTKLHARMPPAPTTTTDVPLYARTYGLRVALGQLASSVRHVAPAPFTARPRNSSVHAAVVDAAGGSLPPPSSVPVAQHLPLSHLGPGSRGSLLLIANVPAAVSRLPVANACGPLSMALHPWAADGLVDDEDDDPPAHDRDPWSGGPLANRQRRAARGPNIVWDKVCPICESGHDDPYHAFFECPSARLRVARRRLFSSIKTPIRALVAAGNLLARGALRPHRQRIAALENAAWDSVDGRATAFRLLCGLQFSARAAPEPVAPLSNMIGTIFDALSTDTRLLVNTARAVVTWAADCTRRTAAARRAAMCDCGAGVTHRPAPPPPRGDSYPHGALISAASHDPRTYTRWKLAHHDECNTCGSRAGTLVGCAHCDLAIHAPGSACSPVRARMPPGTEWLCRACSIAILPFTAALGDGAPVRL